MGSGTENAVDGVESALYKRALAGEVIPAIFYLKAHRPIYRDRLNIDIEQVRSEIEERILPCCREQFPR